MNQHEERAAGVDAGFTDYRAQAQRAFPKISDREMGEAWMRGQAWAASGAKSMVVRERGGAPEPSAADVGVSARYGDLELKVYVNPEELRAISRHGNECSIRNPSPRPNAKVYLSNSSSPISFTKIKTTAEKPRSPWPP